MNQNILVKSKPPDDWWVKLCDFGISKRAEDGLAVSSTLKGTLGFIAPELHGFVESSQHINRRTAADMWALGEIAFQILTKEPTFQAMGRLFSYIQNPQEFPLAILQKYNVSSIAIDFIQSMMKPVPVERMTAEQGLLHGWMEPLKSTNPELSLSMPSRYKSLDAWMPADVSNLIFRSASWEEHSMPVACELLSNPSGKWTTIGPPTRLEPSSPVSTMGKSAQTTGPPTRPEPSFPATKIRILAQTAIDETIKLRKAIEDDRTPTLQLKGHSSRVKTVIFSPDGTMIISVATDKTARLWDAGTGKELGLLNDYKLSHIIAISQDSVMIASGGGKPTMGFAGSKTVMVWSARTGNVRYRLNTFMQFISAIAFLPDDRIAAAGGKYSNLESWNVRVWSTRKCIELYVVSPACMSLGRLWPLLDATTFSPDGKIAASQFVYKRELAVALWEIETGKNLHLLHINVTKINNLAFSPDSKVVAVGGMGLVPLKVNIVCLWDTETGKRLHELEYSPGINGHISFTRDGKTIMSWWAYGKDIWLWDATTGKRLGRFNPFRDCPSGINTAAFSPNGNVVVCGGKDGVVRLYQLDYKAHTPR